MAKKGTLRAVLVGCGGMSRAWLSAAAERSDVDIVGLVDIDEKNAQSRAEEHGLDGAHIGTDLKVVLGEADPDVVFDVTIPSAHTNVTVTALKHGCHVLGEKPLADLDGQCAALAARGPAGGKDLCRDSGTGATTPIFAACVVCLPKNR